VAVLQPAPHPRERSKPLLLNPYFEIVQKLVWSLAQFRATLSLPLGQLPGVPGATIKAEKEPQYCSALFTHPALGCLYGELLGGAWSEWSPPKSLCRVFLIS